MEVKISENSNALIDDKIYFFATKEEKKIANERDIVIDKLIAIQDKLGHACMRDMKWTNLRFKLMDMERELKKTCGYLSPEKSIEFEQGGSITENDIIKQ